MTPNFFSDLETEQKSMPSQSSASPFFRDLDVVNVQQEIPRPSMPSFIPKTEKKGPPTTPGRAAAQLLGLASQFTYPADLYKAYATGEALQGLEELKEPHLTSQYLLGQKQLPVDEEKYMQAVQAATSAIPTQETAEKFIEEKTGLPLRPQSDFEKGIRFASEIFGFLPKKAAKAISESKSPSIVPEIQVPKPPGPTELTKLGQKYEMQPFAGLEIVEPRGPTPVISKGKAKEISRGLSKDAEKVAHAIVKEKIPAAAARERGLDLNKAYLDYIGEARNRAAASAKSVDTKPVIQWIDHKISSISKHSPILNAARQKQIDILQKFKDGLTKKGPGLPHGKKLHPNEVINQFQSNNSDVKRLWAKSERTGLEKAETEITQQINNQLVDAMKRSGNEDVARVFEYSNEIFRQDQNLRLVGDILENAFKNPKNLKKVLKGSNRGHLVKALGDDGVKHLDEIARYQTAVVDRMKDFVKVSDPKYLNIRKLWENLADLPGRIAGYGYTGKNPSNLYIKFQKKFLAKDYQAAEKAAEQLVENLQNPTIEVKPKEISSS